MYLWAVLLFGEMMGSFVACSLGAAQIQEGLPTAVQVKSFTKQGQQRKVCRDLPLENTKERTLSCAEDLLSFPPVLSMS